MAESGFLVCSPMMGETVEQMLNQMQLAKDNGVDCVELGLDCLNSCDAPDLEKLLKDKVLPSIVTYKINAQASVLNCHKGCPFQIVACVLYGFLMFIEVFILNLVSMQLSDENKITIGPPKSDEKDNHVVYYEPISETIRRWAVASSVIFISVSTTAALHRFASPYVDKLKWQPGSDSFEVEMLSWLATYLPKTIQFSDVKHADTNRPYVTFEAKGEYYFIDADRFPNKALLARLTPKQPARTLKNL